MAAVSGGGLPFRVRSAGMFGGLSMGNTSMGGFFGPCAGMMGGGGFGSGLSANGMLLGTPMGGIGSGVPMAGMSGPILFSRSMGGAFRAGNLVLTCTNHASFFTSIQLCFDGHSMFV